MTGARKVTLGVVANLCRLAVAVTFMFSGYVKAMDPHGTQYKIEDYLEAVNLSSHVPGYVALAAAILLGLLEFCLGMFTLLAIRRRLVTRAVLLFMAVMTPLTLWLAVSDPIPDCGCFGDALVLTNWQTFYKNLALLAASLVMCLWPTAMPRFIGRSNEAIVVAYTILFILVTSGISLYTLPPIDFRPYHVGADIREGMEYPPGAEGPRFSTTFLLEKDGVVREFSLEDYPDSTWTFVNSKTVQLSKGYVPPIHDFAILTMDGGEDITGDVLGHVGYSFLLVSPHLEEADDACFGEIDMIFEYSKVHGYPFYALTASGEEAIGDWRDVTGAEYDFYNTDETTLKTVIRSNPGLVLLKDGVVAGKWSRNNLPKLDPTSGRLEDTGYGGTQAASKARNLAKVLLWYILPLLLIIVADRTWHFTKWMMGRRAIHGKVRLSRRKDAMNIKNETMRKKIVAGNWKMNMSLQDGLALAKDINARLSKGKTACEVVICTPFIHLASVAQVIDRDVLGLGAQNCADKESGAYTGEVSAAMVRSAGADYVILGHSERRGYYGETVETLREKVLLALGNGLKVIFCIGESLEEREAGKQNEVVKAELEGSVFNLGEEEFRNITIAYEPIWAIGTGKTATSDQAEEIHAYIRGLVAGRYGREVADGTSILYGGSCKASNAGELFSKPDIDGGLIGGASLKADDFMGIVGAW